MRTGISRRSLFHPLLALRHALPVLGIAFLILMGQGSSWLCAEASSGPEALLPADTIFYASVPDIGTLRAGFQRTPLGSLVRPGAPSVGVNLLMNVVKLGLQFYSGAPMETWLEEFSSPLGFAMFMKEQGVPGGPPPMVFLARLAKGEQAFRAFINDTVKVTLLGNAPYVEWKEEKIGQFTVEHVRDPRKRQAWAFSIAKGYLLLGSDAGVRRALEHLNSSGDSLASSEDFQTARKKAIQEHQVYSYLNVMELVKRLTQRGGIKKIEALGLLALSDASSSLQFTANKTEERLFLGRNAAKTALGLAIAFTLPKPRSLAGAKIIPSSYPIFVSANLEGGEAFYEAVLETVENIQGQEAIAKFMEGRNFIEQAVGLNLVDDFLAHFTGEVALGLGIPTLKESLLAGKQPEDKDWAFLVAFSTDDREAVRLAFDRLLNSQFAWDAGLTHEPFKEEGFEAIEIKNNKKDGPPLAFGFTDDFILLSNSVDVLHAASDAVKASQTVAADTTFQEFLKAYPQGQNLIVRVDLQEFTGTMFGVLDHFAAPQVKMVIKELKPAVEKTKNLYGAGLAQENGFVLNVQSSQGVGLHAVSLGAMMDAIQKSPGFRALAAQYKMEKIADGINSYFRSYGSFPPTLETLVPNSMKRLPRNPFSRDGKFTYYPGPVTEENGRKLYLTGWFIASAGPDRRMDVDLKQFDLDKFIAMTKSNDPENERYLMRVTYQYKPDKYPLEKRTMDRGDIYLFGRTPQ